MNVEEQPLDLSIVKTKINVDDDRNNTSIAQGVIARIADLRTDSDTGNPNNVPTQASKTYLMPHLSDNLQEADEGNQQGKHTLDVDEVNGNERSVCNTPAITSPSNLIFINEAQDMCDTRVEEMKDNKDAGLAKLGVEDGDDGGDMDIGVDLSLDESGVLDAELVNASSISENTLDVICTEPEPTSQDVPAGNTVGTHSDASATDQTVLYPSVQEADDKHKPSGKRVTFPSDEDIVSGAVEPKDPWRHAQNVTVEEILTAYKEACQKLNCKAIPKVLKQIQELKDLTQRNECLDLKGEKLDYQNMRVSGRDLKRVQFKVVDLEQTSLDEDGASALFDMIEYYESATHLNISFNKHIGTRGWQAAAHMMRKTSSLLYLDARNTPLLDHSAPFVARALRISGSLTVLHLENASLSGRPLMLLATALKMNMNLRELYLADNKLNGLQDSAQLGNLLKFNYNIQILDLRNNHILDSGLAYLCEGLKEQRKGLITLVLWSNQLTHNGMGYLAAALPCTQSLETLNLGHNLVGNEGVHKLKDGLITNRSVLRLGLASTKLSCEGAVAVAEFIAESPRLLRLDLRENEIKTGGLMALSLALKVNTSLLRLDLDREPKKETVKSFIETQRALLTEIQNGCKRNFILAKEKEDTEQKMRQSASMAEIATEDGTTEEEVPPSVEQRDEEGASKGETTETEEQMSSHSGESPEANIPEKVVESDSDTEEEEDDEEVISKPPAAANSCCHLDQTVPSAPSVATQPVLSVSHRSPSSSTSPAHGKNVSPGITVTESPAPPGTPSSPGRCISVSSPGRGHKIFMVTRVESPPEQQAQNDHTQTIMPDVLTKKVTETPTGAAPTKQSHSLPTTQSSNNIRTRADQSQPQTSTQTQLTTTTLQTDCDMTEQSTEAHLESKLSTPQIHTLEPQSAKPSQPSKDGLSSTLDPEETNPSLQSRAPPPISFVKVQADTFQFTEEVTEKSQQPECAHVEQQLYGGKLGVEGYKDVLEGWVVSPHNAGGERAPSQGQITISVEGTPQTNITQLHPLSSALIQIQNESESESGEPKTQSPNHMWLMDEVLTQSENTQSPAILTEISKARVNVTERGDTQQNHEGPSPKPPTGQQQIEPGKKEAAQCVLSDQLGLCDSQGQSRGSNPRAGETSSSLKPSVSLPGFAKPPAPLELSRTSPFSIEDSHDESSTDEGESLEEVADMEQEVLGSALPNGLKPEFSLHLLDPETPKPSSCVIEHVSVSCGQQLEELLLEASLEMGRDAP
ncbi:protein phosphatase 1 regulatory subunit 37 [Thalassophryne amazonica]|uniref:protein phosphatase 1 regulatory subunit 37 n=1 Tax=Thalassophryne amazonica TaxID=390379 RepID=UPI001470F509|nr:protein phosphatase 1 regulatory subunit 37 [Thalassophryne amazonica]